MRINSKVLFVVFGIFFSCFGLFVFLGPRLKHFTIPQKNIQISQNLKSFSEKDFTLGLSSEQINSKYDQVRKQALDKANGFIRKRDYLNIVSQALCIFSILASFFISYLGSKKGIVISEAGIEDELDKLKKKDIGFKKKIILYSAITILCTSLSNRGLSYVDKCQNAANEIINTIKVAENKIANCLNLKEANNVVNEFELDVSRY